MKDSLGLPWTEVVREKLLSHVGCAISALDAILEDGYHIAGSLHGGFHHAFANHGAQSQMFNDLAIVAGTSSQAMIERAVC